MKLSELGLSTKPQTKYFQGGYVSFQTKDCKLYFKIHKVNKSYSVILFNSMIADKQHLKELLSIKNIDEVIQA